MGPLLCVALALACASPDKPGKNDPDVRLRKLLGEWQRDRDVGGSCASGGRKYPYADCGRIQAAIERLALEFPSHPPMLEEQVELAPDVPELREALASVHYLLGDFDEARRELRVAERLGAPAWRVAYNRGLLEEAEGYPDRAIEWYRDALAERPGWDKARSRLRGLESELGL